MERKPLILGSEGSIQQLSSGDSLEGYLSPPPNDGNLYAILNGNWIRIDSSIVFEVTASITGLSSTSEYVDFAEIGSQISVLINGQVPDTIQFGSTDGGNEYGSNLPFTIPEINDTANPDAPAPLFISGEYTGRPFSNRLDIRAAAFSIDTPATNSTIGNSIDDSITLIPSVLSNLPSNFTRTLNQTRDTDLEFQTGDGSSNLVHTIVAADDNAVFDGIDTITTSRGVTVINATGSVQVADFEFPEITGLPTTSGTAEVGALITLAAAPVSGNPTPTRTWQKQRQINGAGAWSDHGTAFTGTTYTQTATDESYALRFVQIETNSIGSSTATSIATGVVQSASSIASLVFNTTGPQDSTGDVPTQITPSQTATVDVCVYLASLPKPTAAQCRSTGGGYTNLGQSPIVPSGSDIEQTIPDGFERNQYKLAAVDVNGADGDVAESAAFTMDTTDPRAGSVSFTPGGTNLAVQFTPDDAITSGRYSVWADGTNPSDAAIESGAGSIATVVTGALPADVAANLNLTGLTAGTVHQPTLHLDNGVGGESHLTFADQTTTTASGPAVSGTTGSPTSGTYNDGTDDWQWYKLTGDGSLTFSSGGPIEWFILGGGGSGGDNNSNDAGGGGGGGEAKTGLATVSAGVLSIAVGVGAAAPVNGVGADGSNGGDTVLSGIASDTSDGGGGGGLGGNNGLDGGSGGGSGGQDSGAAALYGAGGVGNNSNNGGQGWDGNSGDNTGGGGGGAGQAGSNGASSFPGDGGDGVFNDYDGVNTQYGGGGGGGTAQSLDIAGAGGAGGGGQGGARNDSFLSTAGTDGLGGGGGGAGRGGLASAGGSGAAIIRFRI